VFAWVRTIQTAGRRLAASLAALADSVDELNAGLRKAAALKGDRVKALPAPRQADNNNK
jgi:hypothetical protein